MTSPNMNSTCAQDGAQCTHLHLVVTRVTCRSPALLQITDEGDGDGWMYGYDQDNNQGSVPSTYVRKILGAGVKMVTGMEHL